MTMNSNIANKLAKSVRQSKVQQDEEQVKSDTAPQATAAAQQSVGNDESSQTVRHIPSRRCWPD